MSHCRPDNESVSVAGAFGRSAGPAAACSSGSCVANPAVDEAPLTRLSLSRLSRNDEVSDRATATPIWSYAYTSDPPAPAIVLAASFGTDWPL